VALAAASEAGPGTLNSQFAQLRNLIEAEESSGWARIDRSAWLKRLGDIQQAIANGNTELAADWLHEMRLAFARHTDDGSLAPDVLRQIETIARANGILLPPLGGATLEDG
jgi:hypothetical protein